MARLVDLPLELLEIIITKNLSFKHELLKTLQPLSYITWAESATQSAELVARTNHLLCQLILTCRRLYNLLQPMLYRQMTTIRSPYLLNRFVRTFESSHALAPSTSSVTIFDTSIERAISLFQLPRITIVQLIKTHGWGAQSFQKNVPPFTSLVENISLIACGASDKMLTELFKWPRSLKFLAYEVVQYDNLVASRIQDRVKNYECNTLVEALSPQRSSLEKLTFTRTYRDRDICDIPLNLSEFTALKTLSTIHEFLISSPFHERSIPRRLPPSLEELQIYYDQGSPGGGCSSLGTGLRHWLIPLLRQKTGRLPRLRKVDLISPEATSWGEPYLTFPPSDVAHAEIPAVRAELPADLRLVVSDIQDQFFLINFLEKQPVAL